MRISDGSSYVCSSRRRTQERLWRIVPLADTDLLRRARQPLDEVLTECIVRHDQSSCAGAALSGRDERGLQHVVNRRIDVFDRSHDQWIVAAHFQREDLLAHAGELLVLDRAGARAAGKEKTVELTMRGDRFAGHKLTLHEIEPDVRRPEE